MALQARHRWVIGKIYESLGLKDELYVEKVLKQDATLATVNAFFGESGPERLLFYYQARPQGWTGEEAGDVLFLTDGVSIPLTGSSVYFFRVSSPGVARNALDLSVAGDLEISYGTINSSVLGSYESMLTKAFKPLIEGKEQWNKASTKESREFVSGLNKFVASVQDSVKNLTAGLELKKPSAQHMELGQQASVSLEVVNAFIPLLSQWCEQVESYIDEDESSKWDSIEKDPLTEIEYWRRRMQRLTSIIEQLKNKDCRTVINTLNTFSKSQGKSGPGLLSATMNATNSDQSAQAATALLRRWRQIDVNISEAVNESKDNVKYLATLEKFLEPLYSGNPFIIMDSLPALLNSVKMIHTISRYYNTTERMSTLFMTISNQLVVACKRFIATLGTEDAIATAKAAGNNSQANKVDPSKQPVIGDITDRIWKMTPENLVDGFKVCMQLNEIYQEQYHITKDKLLAVPKGRQFDFSETQIFGSVDSFCRRLIKLIDMFSTIHQFQCLAKHDLEGMDTLTCQFQELVREFKSRDYDLLNHTSNKFDKEFVEFNVRITDLERMLLQFINRAFECVVSIEESLTLLEKFQLILKRDTLKADLESKLIVIFHNYGLDLTNVQDIYEKYKHAPPMNRNMPPVSGSIVWSRHLLRRIEEPMRKFQGNEAVLATKDAKKIVKSYNKVAKTLVAFEYLWYDAWEKSVEAARSGLQATLVIQDPTTSKYVVNFDPEILQLIREAKCLSRLGIESSIPSTARMVLLQEAKFKTSFNQLKFLVNEYERICGMILPIARDILIAHVEDLDLRIRPGMTTLTWTSMNIDSYIQSVQTGLTNFEDLLANLNDIIENRIEKNLHHVGRCMLVYLPSDGRFTLDEFEQHQEVYTKDILRFLQAKNTEIETAVLDLVNQITNYPLHQNIQPVGREQFDSIRKHYEKLMYHALLQCSKSSLAAIQKRMCAKGSTGFLFVEQPFFELDVQLSVPSVRLVPSLEEIQRCINNTARSVIWCSKSVVEWGQLSVESVEDKVDFFEKIGRDKQIVRSILLLTGALQGVKNKVNDYLAGFSKYDWLWKDDMEYAYRKFIEKNPDIEDFERELSQFVHIEHEIRDIGTLFNIGALSLNTNNLKSQLTSEASQWKVQYSDKVHKQALLQMDNLLDNIKFTQQKLGKDVNSLESLRYVMNVLKDIRERESTIENEIAPILDMYDMLDHYLPSGVIQKDEMDKKSIIRSSWRKLVEVAEHRSDDLSQIQGGFKTQLVTDVREFFGDVMSFRVSFVSEGPMVAAIKPKEAVERLRRFKNELDIRVHKEEILQAGEELFAMRPTEYPELVQTKKEMVLLDQLYGLYIEVVDTMDRYRNQTWAESVEGVALMAEKLGEFENRKNRLPMKLRDWDAYEDLKNELTSFQDILPLLEELSKPSIKQRHWDQVEELSQVRFNIETGKLKELWQPSILNHKDEIEELCSGADKELEIESKLAVISEKWSGEQFEFAQWRTRDTFVLKAYGQIIEDLEESQLACQSMLAMRHVLPFKPQASELLTSISETGETLERWIKVQMLWMSLESVFTGGDIAKQMPQDAKKFSKIDKDFAKIMEKAQEQKGMVIECCANELLKNSLPQLYTELERCQKSLEGYLEQKRAKFPRFYFVSNPVLLQILSQGSHAESMQPYYEKIFDSISCVTHDGNNDIIEIKSQEGKDEEVIELKKPVKPVGNIEDWLGSLEKEMQSTMHAICETCAAKSINMSVQDIVDTFCAQFALLGLQFSWTHQVSNALMQCKTNKSIMSDTNKEQLGVLNALSGMCLKDLGSKMNRTKVETMVTIQVHQRDVFSDLARLFKERKLNSIEDFEWLKQARFYWRGADDGICDISVCDISMPYAYEYLGCKERLAITPLTDRCYVTLTQALGMCFGGAPAGPAGTGKTETVKDLGRTLGIYVVVTNCTDQQRYTDMAKIFKGLCRAGIWGCFDEFNRIELPVLSVVAQQVLAVTNAKRTMSPSLMFPGDPDVISLKTTVGYFITMNPGYAGRQELPENLKALFRNVAMMVPDREIIMRVKLCSVGYTKFSDLAKKFNALYKCCEEQLSKQRHYDFGLRNILSVLRTAGQTKRNNLDADEELLLMTTLRDMNLSKFVAVDVPLFLSLLSDLFPGISDENGSSNNETKEKFKELLLVAVDKKGLQPHPSFLKKVEQVYDTSLVRHGIMIIGPAGGGKTAALELLVDTMTAMGNVQHKITRMNPKALRAEEMFGETDRVSNEWIDGVFASMWSKFNDRNRRDNTWIQCDGPVDAIWIENLNTVLDDNKILTLANGDRIPMTDNVKLLFETEDLNNASPATVSRAGIIYISGSDLGWSPVLDAWIASQQDAAALIFRDLFDTFVTKAELFDLLEQKWRPVVHVPRVSIISSVYTIISEIMSQVKLSDSPSDLAVELEKIFLFSLLWTFGGVLDSISRKTFEATLRTLSPTIQLPKDSAYGYFLNIKSMHWDRWNVPVWAPTFDKPDGFRKNFSNLLIPNSDTTRALYLMGLAHARNKPVLLVGGAGTGKSCTAMMFLEHCRDADGYLTKKFNFSSATACSGVQETVEGELDKRGGRTFGPPNNGRLTIFFDDLSLPEANDWGDQPTLEIVRQVIESKQMAFLDKDKRGDFKVIEDVKYIAAMHHNHSSSDDDSGPKSNGIPNRLIRHFYILNLMDPDVASIDDIYGKMLRSFFGMFVQFKADLSKKMLNEVDKIVRATITLWNKAKSSFLPTPSKFHYVFGMRDLGRVFQGLLRTPAESYAVSDKAVFQLWRHEIDRVFADKLTTLQDKNTLRTLVDDVASKEISKDVVSSFYADSKESGKELISFVDFMKDDIYNEDGVLEQEAPRIYELAKSLDVVQDKVVSMLDEFNESFPSKAMNLVIFRDALSHLLRVVRVLGLPRGNLLLVGVGGSGKQSVTTLAAYICKHELRSIKVTKTYNQNALMDDLREFYRIVGEQRKPVTLLITEAQIKYESFLEVFSSFLSSGEITGLFPKDELMVMAGEYRSMAMADNKNFKETPENLMKYFVNYVWDNLHIVLCVSPISTKYVERARRFPGIFSNSCIDWFLPWPQQALRSVAESKLGGLKIEGNSSIHETVVTYMAEVQSLAIESCEDYFTKVRKRVYQTPKSFLSFLGEFGAMYQNKLLEISVKEGKILVGLKKLAEGAEDVAKMKVLLAQEEIKLRQAEESCNAMLGGLEQSSLAAKTEASQVSTIKSACEKEANAIILEKNQAQEELAAAQPFLDEADEAVNSIKPNDLNELKKLPKPGDVIKLTFDGVMILRKFQMDPVKVAEISLGIGKDKKTFNFLADSYASCQKTMLADSGFLKALFKFSEEERDLINDETIELLMPYLELEGFDPNVARNASKAAQGLCSWVIAMVKYNGASKIVKPKLEQLAVAEAKLEDALKELSTAEAKLQTVKDKLDVLQASFQKAMSEKQAIEEGTALSKRKMEQATALIEGLKDERVRWTADGQAFAEQKLRLSGDCLLASAFLSYCGPFNQAFRAHFLFNILMTELEKQKIPVSEGKHDKFDLIEFLVDPVTVGEWNMQSLPSDPLSTENGILVTNSRRYPLLIDPQGQGLQWIKNKEASNLPSWGTTTLQNPKFKDQLEFCMAEGLALIVTAVEEDIGSMLDPVLEKQVVTRAKTKYITVNDKACEIVDSFSLFLTTRLPNPHFTPELQAKTTVIDFAITMKGLEEQLLGHVIRKEQQALEDQLAEVLSSVTSNSKMLQNLNEDLLLRLSENTGNLLDDTELVGVLASTKKAVTDVTSQLIAADETKIAINEKREQYRAVACRGSILYFSIVDMCKINYMYQVSLDQFMRLFLQSIDDTVKSNTTFQRVCDIMETLTYSSYRYMNRGLYKQDKDTFLMIILLRILTDSNVVSSDMVKHFLRAGAEMDIKALGVKPFGWLSDASFVNAANLNENVDFFKGLIGKIHSNEAKWRAWYESNEPDKVEVPDYEQRFQGAVGAFYRALLLRSLREDRTVTCVHTLIEVCDSIENKGVTQPCLGPKYTEPVTDTIESIMTTLTPDLAVVFLLSSGADPTNNIETACRKRKETVEVVSMGEGQDVVAQALIDNALENGGCVLLQNCHLDLAYMEKLCEILDEIQQSLRADELDMLEEPAEVDDDSPPKLKVHSSFRLFITTEPHNKFPIGLLQRALKVTNEPPAGLKAGMLQSYVTNVSQEMLDRVETSVWRKSIYVLCFLHSVVQERRSFGYLGWNIPYEFSVGDLEASLTFLERHLTGSAEVSWDTVQYMIAEVQYGGRVTDDLDRRLLLTFTETYLKAGMLAKGFTLNGESFIDRPPFVYSVVDAMEHVDYSAAISLFPALDPAEILGLHPNAEISARVQRTRELIDAVIETQPKGGGDTSKAGGLSREEMVIQKAEELAAKIPPIISAVEVAKKVEALGGYTIPLNVVLAQEYERFTKVILMASATLKSLKQAISGEIAMTEELSNCLDAIFNARPPKSWIFSIGGDEISWQSSSIANWFAVLQDRYNQFTNWLNTGRPVCFWFPGFSNPQGFLTALKQEITRLHVHDGWALDSVVTTTQVTKFMNSSQVRAAPKEGLYIDGLFLEAARWDTTACSVQESMPKQLYTEVPVLLVNAVLKSNLRQGNELGPYGGYSCPVYKYPNRRDMIFDALIPSKQHKPSHWIMRGTAMLMSTDM